MEVREQRAIEEIKLLIDEANDNSYEWIDSIRFAEWRNDARAAIVVLFGEDSKIVRDWDSNHFHPIAYVSGMSESVYHRAYNNGMKNAVALLRSAYRQYEKYHARVPSGASIPEEKAIGSKVFVVHGHDNEIKQEVARFVEKMGLIPVILHEQPNQGRTIIEKFESYSEVSFAIILLTPDDHGAVIGQSMTQPRARQNVVFELGFFVGRLGRSNVCAIRKGDVEIPSDMSGALYTEYGLGEWKNELVRELKNAGFDIDANRAFQ